MTAAVLAYSAWGFFPLYWHLLKRISALETMSHRVIWSLFFYAAVASYQGQINSIGSAFRNLATLKRLTVAAALIAFNWLLYVWSVTHGHVIETSLGYFIIPLINVVIGAVVFKEHLSKLQKLSLFFALIGVSWLTFDYGRPPWIALGLAVSFSIYGYIKKTVKGDATAISMVETTVLFPFAVISAFAIRLADQPLHGLFQTPTTLTAAEWGLMVGGGAITGIPLLLFGVAAQRLPFSILGFFQYLSPTFQFLTAVYFFNEPMDESKLAGFLFIWIALTIFLFHLKNVSRSQSQSTT